MQHSPQLLTALLKKGIERSDIIGCSDDELALLQHSFPFALPTDYLEAMETLGRKAGPLFEDSVFYFPEVARLTEEVKAWLFEALTVPESYFCFLNNLSSTIVFIDTSEQSSQRIYRWRDGNPSKFERLTSTLDELLLQEIDAL